MKIYIKVLQFALMTILVFQILLPRSIQRGERRNALSYRRCCSSSCLLCISQEACQLRLKVPFPVLDAALSGTETLNQTCTKFYLQLLLKICWCKQKSTAFSTASKKKVVTRLTLEQSLQQRKFISVSCSPQTSTELRRSSKQTFRITTSALG